MTGVELIIGGQFASSVIRKVVNFGSSYLGENYDLHTRARKMLKNLEIQLPQIQCVMEAAEKQQITSRGLDTWLDQLKDAAYEAEDVLDDFEAKRIRKSIKGKGQVGEIGSASVKMVKTLIFSDKDLKRLESVLDNLDKVCMRMGDFIKTLELIHSYKGKEHLNNLGSETSSNLAPDVAIFGRDIEIELILDMIFNVLYRNFYHQDIDDCNLQQGEGERSNSFWGLPTILGTAQSLFTQSRAVIATRRDQQEVPSRNRLTGPTITNIPLSARRTPQSSSSSSSTTIRDRYAAAEQSRLTGTTITNISLSARRTPRSSSSSSSTTIRDRYAVVEQSRLTWPAITTIPTLARSTSGSRSSSSTTIRDRYAAAKQSRLTGPAIATIPTLARSTSGSRSGISTTIRDRHAAAEQSRLTGPAITTIPTLARSTSGSRSGISSSSTAPAITTSNIRDRYAAPEQNRFRLHRMTNIVKPQSINNRKLAVIPIVGVGGVGKTIVAKMIYNDEKVKEHFALRAWVYVSESCDAKKIMQEMLCSFKGGVTDPFMNLENVGNNLKEIITNHRFILVLDDLRDKTQLKWWSDLRSVLCYGEVGSVVVITTQSRSIANTTGTLPRITLDVLPPESFWELFQYYAFGGFKLGDLNEQPPSIQSKQKELELIGNKIAGKLHGLPLAGKVIGTLLSYKLEREFWDDVCGSDWWNIKDARENILPSIGVGYNYLDPELKQCFLFCSIFPKHYVFERERLVQMWIAQGFIQPSKEETGRLDKGETRLEDIGRKWFGELVERSFFQPTLSDGKYIMHDLVRDMAKAVSSNEFCFIKSHDNHLPSLARHVGIDCDNSEVEWKSNDSTRLRTMILFGNWTNCCAKSISNIFAKYNGLRVLDLSYIMLKTDEPINAASRLWHLRFVDLSFTGIKSIPHEFCALYHLQVLDLRGCFLTLPQGINQLINLQHLYGHSYIISRISSIGKLTKLQELEELCIENYEGRRISELMNMNEISGHLLLRNIHYVSSKEEAAKSQLDKKKYLKSLDLRCDDDYPDSKRTTKVTMEVLDALKPGRSLEILKIGNCKWESLPSWVFSPHHGFYNLKVVHVYTFWLSSLPPFGELHSLEVLSFDNLPSIEKVSNEFYGSSDVVFPSLKELTFSRMSSWRNWSDADAGKTVFPLLKKLCIENCRVLKELPVEYSFTSSVVELVLKGCPDLCNIETVLRRMPSLAHLSIKSIYSRSYSINCTPLNSLEVMYLSTFEKLRFVGGLKSLVNLRKLVIEGFCEILETCEVEQDNNEISQEKNEEQCLQFLKYLHLRHAGGTQNLPIVVRLSALRTLLIENSPATEYTIEEENWFNQLTSLEKLEFRKCWKLRFLPSQLHLLTSLKKLHINRCPQMLSLPENGLPQSLVELYIDYCPDLICRCEPNKGNDWHKISHIPVVQFKKERWEQTSRISL